MNSKKSQQTKRRGRPPLQSNIMDGDPKEWLISNKKTENDACDCLNENCSGCWYPCETCGSNKCSTFCRTTKRDQLEWRKSN